MALLRDTETWFAPAKLLLNGYFTDCQEIKLQIASVYVPQQHLAIHPPAVKRVRVGTPTC